jgi:hypothetical protein
VDVAVNKIIRAVAPQASNEIARVGKRSARMQARDYLGAQAADLFVVDTGLGGMDEEIHSVPVSIDVPQNVHKPSLDARWVHRTHHVQDPGLR